MLLVNLLRSAALTLLLFVVVYIPAFFIAASLHLTTDAMVPTVIAITLVLACVLMGVAIHRGWLGADDFGWQWPPYRYLLYALLIAVPLSAVIALIQIHIGESGSLDGLHLAPWQLYLCFGLGAPVQEEAIFRGLLQSSLAKSLASRPAQIAAHGLVASLAVAVLFGAIHLKVGVFTALAALILGVLAGELKRRSGSLLPSMVCHAIFNLGGLLLAVG
jgi:membrane protease YdiL (CAAX protease family)